MDKTLIKWYLIPMGLCIGGLFAWWIVGYRYNADFGCARTKEPYSWHEEMICP